MQNYCLLTIYRFFCLLKGYDNTSGSSETVISSRIPSTKESTFRRPLIPQAYHRLGTPDAFKTQLDVNEKLEINH